MHSFFHFLLSIGKKISQLPSFISLISISCIIFVLIFVNLPNTKRLFDGMDQEAEERRIGESYYDRLSEIPTWTANQSRNLTDYLDLTNSSSFLLQPGKISQRNKLALDNSENVSSSSLCGPNVNVLIMVTSAPPNFQARIAIRETWGSKNYLHQKGVRMAFVLGRTENDTVQEYLHQEAKQYDDIIQEDFLDAYHNLTLKSMAILKWVNLTCKLNNNSNLSSPMWILKSDDDMFINIDRLLPISYASLNSKMIGYLVNGALPVKDPSSKMYMPKYLYPSFVYPPYLSGSAYLLKSDVVIPLLENSINTSLIHMEDIYVTGILPRRTHFFPHNSAFFNYERIDPTDHCAFKKMVSIHRMTPNDLRLVWSNMTKKNLTVSCSPRKNSTIKQQKTEAVTSLLT